MFVNTSNLRLPSSVMTQYKGHYKYRCMQTDGERSCKIKVKCEYKGLKCSIIKKKKNIGIK